MNDVIEPPSRVERPEEAGFWQAIDEGRLDLFRCDDCGAWSGFARSCVTCGSPRHSLAPASGRGLVRSFAIFHRPYHKYFAAEVPYNVAVVALEEGPDLLTNVVDVELAELVVGMPVEVVVRERGGAKIPQAVPVRSG